MEVEAEGALVETGKCIPQLALIAEQRAKFLSNRKKAGLFIAGTATENTSRADSKAGNCF